MSLANDLALIAAQEQTLQFARFAAAEAWQLGLHLREMARARSLPVVIDLRRFDQPLFYCALAGSVPDNAEWARRKANVVARFHRSSYHLGQELRLQQSTLAARYDLPAADYAAHGGAFPLTVVGVGVIGAVTVSGLPQRADHDLVVEALAQVLGHDAASLRLPPEV